MSKRTNPMAVKSALAYTVEEAANALSKTPATIRNWVKDGLPIMASHKPYLISGAAIREYLRAKRKDAKRPLEPDELYCPACRQRAPPNGHDRNPFGSDSEYIALERHLQPLRVPMRADDFGGQGL